MFCADWPTNKHVDEQTDESAPNISCDQFSIDDDLYYQIIISFHLNLRFCFDNDFQDTLFIAENTF